MSNQTPAAHWRQNGEDDPFGKRYECERASLPMGHLTDDELANAVFMYGDSIPSATELMNGAHMPIAYLTAAKERIRWLSRQLELVAPPASSLARQSGRRMAAIPAHFRGGINMVIEEEQKLSGLPFEDRDDE